MQITRGIATDLDLAEFVVGDKHGDASTIMPDQLGSCNQRAEPQTSSPVEQPPDPNTLHFEDSIELLSFFHPDINEHKVILHPWQLEVGEKLCNAKATSQHPFKFCLCAANGSGKDAFVIAPFALWFILAKRRSLVVITSSSGVQLSRQTENYISSLAKLINRWHLDHYGEEILKINQRHIQCLLTGGEIILFATDEEGKAEGYHPLEPDAEMAIIVNEAKSVTPDIFRALRRCTGYNYWILVSTPGEPAGDFYKAWTKWPHKRKVTFYDCPHLSKSEFEADKIELGENSPLFRSKWLALFTTVGGLVVVNSVAIERCRDRISQGTAIWYGSKWPIRVGIDLAAGGDENVISIWRGGKQLRQIAFREFDTTRTTDRIAQILSSAGIEKTHDHIFADDGGVGRAIIQMLKRKGWNIKRVLNQSPARRKQEFRNRGAELWFKFARFMEEGFIWPTDDEKLWEQLGSRHYKKSEEAAISKIQLESKLVEKENGYHSPDRADAAILAFTDVSFDMFMKDNLDPEPKATDKRMTLDQLQEIYENLLLKQSQVKQKPVRGSLNVVMKHRRNQNRLTYGRTYSRV